MATTFSSGTIHTYPENTWAFSDVVAGADGKFYLAHKDDAHSGIEVMHWNGSAWVEYASFSASDAAASTLSDDLDLVIDASGNLHIVFRHETGSGTTSDRGVKYGVFNGSTWSFSKIESASDPNGWKNYDDPSLAVDANGVAHVAYKYTEAATHTDYLKYATNSGGTWSTQVLATGTPGTGTGEIHDPWVAIAADGSVNVTFVKEDDQNEVHGNLYFTAKSLGGSFSTPSRVINAVAEGFETVGQSAMDAEGNIHNVFYEDVYDQNGNFVSSALYDYTNVSGTWVKQLIFTSTTNFLDALGYQDTGTTEYLLVREWDDAFAVTGARIYYRHQGSTWTAGNAVPIDPTSQEVVMAVSADGTVMIITEDSSLRNVNFLTGDAIAPDATPPVAPSAPNLVAISDSGSSSTDNITFDTTPTFSGAGAEAGATVRLYANGTEVGSTTADSSGNWTVTSSARLEGTYTFTARVEDLAGNLGPASSGLAVTIDYTKPVAPSAPDLAGGSDTGSSSTDNITSDTTPTLTGTAEAGATVRLYDGGDQIGSTTADTAGNWTITVGPLVPGNHTFAVTAEDAAGNVSSASTGVAISIDTGAPSLTITSNKSTLKAGETATITFNFSEDPGATFTHQDIVVSGGTLGSLSGSGLTRIATFTPSPGINGGTASITVSGGAYADEAGNYGMAGSTPSISFDTAAPDAPSGPDLTDASDSGVSIADNWTNVTTPTLTGTAEEGSTVTLYNGTTVVGTGVAVGGVWSIATSELVPGAHKITAVARDVGGNVSRASISLTLAIDTTAPIATPSDSTPADDVTDIAPDSNIVLRFDSPVELGTGGSIILYNVTDGTVLETIPYNSPSITGWGSTALTIDPLSLMPGGKTIAMMWSGSAFQDRAGNFVAANATNSFYNFTVKEDPQAPTATNLTQTVEFLEDGGPVALGDIVITEPNLSESVTATLALSDPAAGSLSVGTYGSAASTFDAVTGVWTITGSVADVNAALAAVAFTPSSDRSQTVTIAARIRDTAGTGPADGTITLNASPRNDAPASGNGAVTLLEDSPYMFKAADFAFADPIDAPAPNAFLSIVIDALPDQGILTLNGVTVVAGQEISIADVVSGNLVFTPGTNEHEAGLQYSSFTFRVRDNGGTANGGINTSAQYTMRIDVMAVNDPAVVGGDVSGGVTEDTVRSASGTLTVSDVDLTEAGFRAMADVRGSYGTFSFDHLTGTWTYQLDNGSPAVQALDNGEVRQETFTVKTVDGTEKSVTVTINGASDTNWVDLNNTISGGSGRDTIFGGAGSDRLSGGGGNDRMDGGSGDDTVSGGSGNDRVYGGSGNDRAYGDSGNDRLYGDDGSDRLSGGSGNDRILGGSGRDTIFGGSGNDKIYGGLGADLLNGGAGRDSFVFDTKPGKGNVDIVQEFNPFEDRIILDNAVFKKVGRNGTLDEDAFWWGKEAHDASDRILYDLFTGTLSYDADGTGSAAAVKIAQMDPWLLFNHESFRVI